jgi:4'-phosphopantetheinyl transferase
VLDQETSARGRRFRYAEDSAAFVVTHAMLRLAVAERTGVPPRRMHLRRRCAVCGDEAHGKPVLVAPSGEIGCEFNISHSRGIAVVAIGGSEAVGVDVERCDARTPWAELRDVFTDRELDLLSSSPGADTGVRLWVRKEAVLKLTGHGLARAPSGVDVADTSIPAWTESGAAWISDLPTPAPYVGALASGTGRPQLRWRPMSVADLLAAARSHTT